MDAAGHILIILIPIMLFSGCTSEDINNAYNTAYLTTTGDDRQGGFDFSEGVASHDSLSNMVLEPWWNNGEPAPCLQHTAWGDSIKKIVDLGEINLDDAINLDPDGMIPDTNTQSDMWDVTKPLPHHAYYITTLENNNTFFNR